MAIGKGYRASMDAGAVRIEEDSEAPALSPANLCQEAQSGNPSPGALRFQQFCLAKLLASDTILAIQAVQEQTYA